MNNDSPISKLDIATVKKYLIIATIVLVSVCAFLGIIMIFVGSNLTVMRVMSTLFIMYLVLLCSVNNFMRTESEIGLVRGFSITALVANFLWSIPWILLVWDAFDALGSHSVLTIWKLVGSGMVVSAFCTFLASRIMRVYYELPIIKFFKSLPLVCAGFLGLDILLVIWIDDMDGDIIWKLILSELILVLLQWIITQILMHNAWRLGINTGQAANPNPTPNQTAPSVPVAQDDAQAKQILQNQTPTTESDHAAGAENTEPQSATSPFAPESDHEAELRAQIEREVRAKIAAEQQAQQNHTTKES